MSAQEWDEMIEELSYLTVEQQPDSRYAISLLVDLLKHISQRMQRMSDRLSQIENDLN